MSCIIGVEVKTQTSTVRGGGRNDQQMSRPRFQESTGVTAQMLGMLAGG